MAKTQIELVLEHLEKHGSITSIEAIRRYGATRLSDIIFRLRRRGYKIISERLKVKNRQGNPSNPVKYILKKESD